MTDKIEEQNSQANTTSLPDDTEKKHPDPKNKPSSSDKKISTAASPQRTSSLLPFLAILLSIIVSISALGVSGWLFYQTQLQQQSGISLANLTNQQTQFNQELSTQQDIIRQIQPTLLQLQSRIDGQITSQLNELDSLNQNTTRFDFDIQVLKEKLKRLENTTKEDWKLAEAEYLIRLANQRLLMEKDVIGAKNMLLNADDILEQLDDPLLFDVRRTLAQDIQQLVTAPSFDLEGIYLQLETLRNQIKALPQKGHQRRAAQQPTIEEQQIKAEAQPEKGLVDELLSTLKSLVIINYHDRPIKPLLPPVEYQQLVSNMQLQLNIAQLALLKQEDHIYQSALHHITTLTMDYFDTNVDVVQHFLVTTAELKQRQIAPQLPLPRASLLAIKDAAEVWHNTPASNVLESTKEETK
ncbi:heme biosynthesis protein HemY [Marinomonas agarivorans]|nr:heme biosynthesis protein HemY [Marinomonas agarivorans]